MLEIRLLGQFEARLDDKPALIPSRPAQSLLAFLALNAGIAFRREKLAGLLWPDATEANARSNLRHELWRLRKTIEAGLPPTQEYFLTDDISIAFNASADFWLDAAVLSKGLAQGGSIEQWMNVLALYRGELLPGFYDDWVLLERERLQARFEQNVQRLLDRLVQEQRWSEVLEWGERWIALGPTPEPAYRALMQGHAALGNAAQVAVVYQRGVEALREDFGVEPSEQTRALYVRLRTGENIPAASVEPTHMAVARTGAPAMAPRRTDEPPAPGEPPYKGMQYFDEDDADLFFGRELLTAKLVARLRQNRFLAIIVGASGSGKSSVVRAGLVPALKRGMSLADGTLPPHGSAAWTIHVFTPTAHPLDALAAVLASGNAATAAQRTVGALREQFARDPRGLQSFVQRNVKPAVGGVGYLLLVADQFEELFTLCQDEFERAAFVDNLLAAVTPGPEERAGSVSLVITLRADFYTHCAQYPNLREAVARSQEYIGPMSPEELQRAIEEPARRGGWELEPGLADAMLREVGDQPGALPLLSHALLETWKRRRGRTLTLKGYAESGGVRSAIAQTAETVFNQLTPEQQRMARNIFLRLTELGEDTQATRRRATYRELIPHPAAASAVRGVLKTLADARLITTGEDTAEVAHEALIREWQRLLDWLTGNRAGLILHRHLTTAAQAWDRLSRDAGELYRGARLAQAMEWLATNPDEPNDLERAFLWASQQAQEREQEAREAQRQRELHAVQQLAEMERRHAEEQAHAARLAQHEARVAQAREWTLAALSEMNRDPERSLLLALQAANRTYSDDGSVLLETQDALHQAIQASHVLQTFSIPNTSVVDILFSAGSARFVTLDGYDTLKLWIAASRALVRTIRLNSGEQSAAHGATVNRIAFSPDSARIATCSADLTAKIWDAATGNLESTLSGHGQGQVAGGLRAGVVDVAFSPDGMRVVTAGADHTAKIWDRASGRLLHTLVEHTAELNGATFSPDGRHVATAALDGTARVWNAATGDLLLTLKGHVDSRIWALAYSPDGARIATGSRDRTAIIWDAGNGQRLLTLTGHGTTVNGVTFSADGQTLATGALDGTAKVWQLASGRELLTLAGHTDVVHHLSFSPDGTRLYTLSRDGTAKVWDLTPGHELLTFYVGAWRDFAMSPDGTRVATASDDATAQVWDMNTGAALRKLDTAGSASALYHITFSQDGMRLAAGCADGSAKIWDAHTGRRQLTLAGHAKEVIDAAFSPDGARVATFSLDGSAKVWDAVSGRELLTIPDAGRSEPIGSIRFSPDGARLIAPGDGLVARVYDAAGGQRLFTLEGHLDVVSDVAWSPDGLRIATASGDKTANVWDAETGELLQTLRGHANYVNGVIFSRDGTRIATAGADKTARVWDAVTGALLLTLNSPAEVENLVFSPDGARLITANRDKMLRSYALRAEDLMALAKSRVTRTLTPDECLKFLHLPQCPDLQP